MIAMTLIVVAILVGSLLVGLGLGWVLRTYPPHDFGRYDGFDLPPPVPVDASIEDQPPTDFDG